MYFDYCEAGSNIDMKLEPEEYPELPAIWYNLHKAMTPKQLETFPLYTQFEIDLIHVAGNPVPLQPKQSNNLNKFKTYFLSPRKIMTTLISWGRDYTFCDRFNGEH